ncbi:MAG: hypothetical protein KME52_11960 [Desmonostoc geniculatum HA4340-LM1]|jgi:hypothetical protein|nr:hypothetical protein [Desmonostoc geniculatum HA4340-LM1]
MKNYYNDNAPMINEEDATSGLAVNFEDEVRIRPSNISAENCKSTNDYSQGLCSTTYKDDPGCCGKTESRQQ